jgi:hypothetical protein
MNLTFNVIQQHLSCSSTAAILAAGSKEYVTAQFSFSEEWEDTVKTAVFYTNLQNAYHVLLSDGGSCTVPSEVLTSKKFTAGVFGVRGTERITSTVVDIHVRPGSYTPGTVPPDPAPDVWDQILAALAGKKSVLVAADYTGADTLSLANPDALVLYPAEGN